MNVAELRLEGFLVHRATTLTLPARGIVTLTGPNGSGKSSVIEAVSFAGWGRTLRGASPWPITAEGKSASGRVQLDGPPPGMLRLQRVSVRASWIAWISAARPRGSNDYDTATKAQHALEEEIGSWDVWRRTHVFSSQDAAHFSTATDKERKLLLEQILGLERFDRALARARDEARDVARACGDAERHVAVAHADAHAAREALVGAQRRLEAVLAEPIPDLPTVDPDALEAEARRVEVMAKKSDADAKAARQREVDALASVSSKGGELSGLRARLGLLEGRGQCPTCEQPVPPRVVLGLRGVLIAEEARQHEAQVRARNEAKQAREDANDLADEAQALRSRVQDLRVRAAQARGVRSEHAREALQRGLRIDGATKDAAEAKASLAAAEDKLRSAEGLQADHRRRQQVLAAVDDVLGLKGVRAHILGRCLAGLEQAAAVWLTRLSYDLMILRLQPYSEKKAGGLTDAISVKVSRRADGEAALREYDSLSGGERRRVDVSLLLSLSEAAAAAHGRVAGTLFFDEVFDALDVDGVAAVGEALRDLAADRCVLVISHSPQLVEALPAALRLRAEAGKLIVES